MPVLTGLNGEQLRAVIRVLLVLLLLLYVAVFFLLLLSLLWSIAWSCFPSTGQRTSCLLLQDREEPVGSSDTVEVSDTGTSLTDVSASLEAEMQQRVFTAEQASVNLVLLYQVSSLF